MSETARRLSGASGSDIARRLIARPIRTQAERHLRSVRTSPPKSAEPAPPMAAMDEPEPADAALGGSPDFSLLMETQIQVMKAVIEAERRENGRLRAVLELDDTVPLGSEARAVHERWAKLVDHLLQASH